MNGAYSRTIKTLHWLTALLVFGLLFVGAYMAGLDISPFKLKLYGLHKSFGMLVFALVLLRVVWHALRRPPAALPTHSFWEKFLAKLVHVILYLGLIFMPLTGWLMSSAGDFSNSFFGLFEMPDLVAKDEGLFKITRAAHEILSFVLLAALLLHIVGAAKHHVIDRDETLQRMTSRGLGTGRGILLVAFFCGLWALAAAPVSFEMINIANTKNETHSPQDLHYVKLKEGEDGAVSKGQDGGDDAPLSTGAWAIDYQNSAIRFEATQYGQVFQGAFQNFDGAIIFDPEDLAGSNVDITIDIGSIGTGSDDRDAQAVGTEWFDTAQFPQAHFVSRRFEQTGPNRYVAYADLTLRGVTKQVEMPFSLEITGNPGESHRAVMQADLLLNRLDFGIGQGPWQATDTIGADVKLHIEVQAKRP